MAKDKEELIQALIVNECMKEELNNKKVWFNRAKKEIKKTYGNNVPDKFKKAMIEVKTSIDTLETGVVRVELLGFLQLADCWS
jgi:hypothetical protein